MTDPAEPQPIDITPAANGGETIVAVKRRKAPLILSGAVALALAVGAGVFVGYQMLFGGHAAAERIPGTALAYVSIDLQSGLDQTRKLMKLAEKFPQTGNSADPKKALDEFLTDLKLDGVDPKQDLGSWVGLRVGAAAWLHHDKPYAILAVQSTDDAAATQGLGRIREKTKHHLGFVVRDGFALLAIGEKDSQAAADAAAAEAQRAPLSKAVKFADARAWLQDDQIAILYLDLGGVNQMMEAALAPEAVQSKQAKASQGEIILGVRAEDDGIVARFRTFGGAPASGGLKDALAKLGEMPASADIAAVAGLPTELTTSASLFGSMLLPFGMLGAGPPDGVEPVRVIDSPVTPVVGDLTPQEEAEYDALLEKAFDGTLTAAEEKRFEELSAKSMGDIGGGPSEAEMERVFKLLSGATIQLALSGVAQKSTAVHIVAQLLSSPTEADLKSLTELTDGELAIEAKGTTVTAVTKGHTPGGGRLADDKLFQRAFDGMPGEAQLAVFVNLDKLMTARERDRLGPVKAIAIAQGTGSGLVRVLIG
ncbi:hypothetical protein [Catelliglobosispora koreensis]|uniref:hypothetical protein n=1 Tax=Catelliglobosispora koreensis TaxID=129052 RepID=UPI00036E7743|nr:hypothetical protein [Catelliglobosispora koreensis]